MKKQMLYLFVVLLVAKNPLQAQTFSLKKEIVSSEIDAFVDSLPAPSKTVFNFGFNENDLKGVPLKNEQTLRKEFEEAEKKLQVNPQDITLQLHYHETMKKAFPLDTAKIKTYAKERIELLKQVIKQKEQAGEANFQLSEIYLFLGDVETAHLHAAEANELMPDSAKTWTSLGYLFMQGAEYPVAKEFFDEAIKRDQQNIYAHMMRLFTDLFEQMNKLTPEDFFKLKIDNLHTKQAFQIHQTQPLETLLFSSELLEIFYQNMAILMNLDSSSEDLLKEFTTQSNKYPRLVEIRKFYEKLLKTRKGDNSFLYNALGFVEFLEKKFDKAAQMFEESIQANPDKMEYYNNLAFVHISRNKMDKAKEVLVKKIKHLAQEDDYCALAKIYSSLDDLEMRNQTLNEGMSKFAQSADIPYYIALIAYEDKDFEKALKYTITSIENNQNNLEVVTLYAALFLREGKIQEALDPLYYAKSQGSEEATLLFDTYFEED